MRIIVNESQYKSILKTQQSNNKLIENWATFIMEKMLINTNGKNGEVIIVENNLGNKLKRNNFYNHLPLNKIIMNIVEGPENKWNYKIETLLKENEEKSEEYNVEIEYGRKKGDKILKENIINILNEIYTTILQEQGYAPAIIDVGDINLDLLDEINIINRKHYFITDEAVIVSGTTDNSIRISKESLQTQEHIDKLKDDVSTHFNEKDNPTATYIEKIEETPESLTFFFNNVVTNKEVYDYYENYEDEKGRGGNILPVNHSGLNDISYSDRAEGDKPLINPNLINDIATAANNAGVKLQITWAKTGHDRKTKSGNISRHYNGNAVDISEIDNGQGELSGWDGKDNAQANGTYDSIIKFNKELDKLGYHKNAEYSSKKRYPKAYLTFGFDHHDDHIHVSNTNR